MKTQTVSHRPCGFPIAFGVFACVLAGLWCLPSCRTVLFPYRLLSVRDASQHWHPIFNHAQAMWVDAAQGSLAALGFGTLARKESPIVLLPTSLAALTLITAATHKAAAWLGMDFHWSFWC
jgi:hypothetical protein